MGRKKVNKPKAGPKPKIGFVATAAPGAGHATPRDPGFADFERACSLHQGGELLGAEKHYRLALQTNPELVDAWRNLGAMLRQRGKTAEGLHCTEQALKRCPQDQSLWGNAGNALRDLGRIEESKRAFEKALAMAPEQLGPLLGLAITLNKAGEHWPLIQRVLPQLDGLPQQPNTTAADLLLEVGNAYHHLGQSPEALAHWRRALDLAEGEKQLLMVLNTAQVLCELQRQQDAEELLLSQLPIHPKSANLRYALGIAVKGLARWEEACQRFEEALELDPSYAICLNSYGLVLRDIGRSHQARSWVHQLRAQCDAVIVGGGTLRADDPLLTSRGRRDPEPLRVVLSRRLELPDQARLWDQRTAPTLVAHGAAAPAAARERLDHLGVERLELTTCEPLALLEALAARGCKQVLWECGPDLAAAALDQGCVQALAAVVAPKLLGGVAARTPLGELGLTSLEGLRPWHPVGLERLGPDLLWQLEAP